MVVTDRRDKKTHNHKRWFLDVNSSIGNSKQQDLPAPYSYVKNAAVDQSQRNQSVDKELLIKRSWDIALGPIKQVPMNLFVMWMAGNSISIFPIMMVGMMAVRPIQAFIGISQTFKMIEGDQAPLQKFTYILGNMVAMALAVYKCNSMGILPTHASDWLTFAQPPQRMEYVAGGISLQ